jgi:hypothetical protein
MLHVQFMSQRVEHHVSGHIGEEPNSNSCQVQVSGAHVSDLMGEDLRLEDSVSIGFYSRIPSDAEFLCSMTPEAARALAQQLLDAATAAETETKGAAA